MYYCIVKQFYILEYFLYVILHKYFCVKDINKNSSYKIYICIYFFILNIFISLYKNINYIAIYSLFRFKN